MSKPDFVRKRGTTLRQSIRTVKLTSNEAEYEAMVTGLELAKGLGVEVIEPNATPFSL